VKLVIVPIDGNLVVEFKRLQSGAWEIRKYTRPNRPDKPDYRLPTKILKAMGILLVGQNLDTTHRSLLWQRVDGVKKSECEVEH
jgi:hypothetical protein